LIKPRQHSYSIVKVLNSASEMKILQYVTDLWTMNITFYKEKLNPLSSLMTGATYWCKKQTAIVLVSDRQRNAASQKLSKPMILARYFIHVWIGVARATRSNSHGEAKSTAEEMVDYVHSRQVHHAKAKTSQKTDCDVEYHERSVVKHLT